MMCPTTNTVTATIPVGTIAFAPAVRPDGSLAYMTNNNGVTVIYTGD
jgi:DNA-binding beta-propeller fold protein YncE